MALKNASKNERYTDKLSARVIMTDVVGITPATATFIYTHICAYETHRSRDNPTKS